MATYSYINNLNPSEPVSYLANPSVTYPEDTQVATFGPIYLPKVYGKDLTAFEIASSGKIALTIRDFYALDLDRPGAYDGVSNVSMLQTRSNGSLLLATTNSNASVFLNADQGTVNVAGTNAFVKVASDMVDGFAGSNFTVLASNDLTLNALQGAASLSVPRASVTLSNDSMLASASNLVSVYAGSNVSITSDILFSSVARTSATLGSGSDTAAPTAYVTATPTQVTTFADVSQTTACNVLISSSNATLTSLASTTVSASNALSANATWSTDHFQETVSMTGGVITSTADTKHDFFIYGEGVPRLSIDNQGMSLNGNLRISGTIDSVNTTETNLQVYDKLITVGVSGSNGVLTDADVSGAGLKVEGATATAKALLWQFQGAYANLATDAGRDNEPAWELTGGGLRISHSNLSFKMRLGEGGELELVKKVGVAPAKVVARFGRTLL